MRAGNNRRTIYDVMEDSGAFRSNPANADSISDAGEPLYRGPVQYPKMLYHPMGETRVTVPGEMMLMPNGEPQVDWKTKEPIIRGEQREIIWEMAETEADEKRLLTAGWHSHPAEAIAASGKPAPPMGAGARITSMEAEIAAKEAENERLRQRLEELGEEV